MKTQKKHYQLCMLAILFLMLLCLPSVNADAKVKMSKKTAGVGVNATIQLKVKGTKKKVTWYSTKNSVAIVNQWGLVKGLKPGNCYIKAKVGKKTYKCKLSVTGLTTNILTLQPGSKATLGVYNGGSTKWYSNNYGVASVNSKGVVTANGYGVAVISCVSKGGVSYCSIYVPKPNITSVNAKIGDQFLFGLSNAPDTPSYMTTDPNVVSVSADGVCTAVGRGFAYVVVSVGGCNVRCSVVVQGDGDVTTPTSWITGSSRKAVVSQVINGADGKRRVYNIFGQSYSDNKIKTNASDGYWVESSIINPSTGAHYVARVYKDYLAQHGCAACSVTTVLSAYADYKGKPSDLILEVEKEVFGEENWFNNYIYKAGVNTSGDQMPISLYGMQKILKYYGIDSRYVRSFGNIYTAWDEITEHLFTGRPVIIEANSKNTVTGASDTRWSNSKHTMVLLGITDQGKVIVADPADRSSSVFGSWGRIKLVDMSDVGSYIFSCTSSNTKPYYSGEKYCGGYILVDKQEHEQ